MLGLLKARTPRFLSQGHHSTELKASWGAGLTGWNSDLDIGVAARQLWVSLNGFCEAGCGNVEKTWKPESIAAARTAGKKEEASLFSIFLPSNIFQCSRLAKPNRNLAGSGEVGLAKFCPHGVEFRRVDLELRAKSLISSRTAMCHKSC